MTASELKTVVLHRGLAEHMDTETADALIERLPPHWEQLATKTDLAQFATKADFEQFATKADLEQFATKADLAELRTELSRDLRSVTYMIIGFALAVVGMFATILVAGVPAAG